MYSHFVDYNNPNSFASRARQKRSLLLRTLIDECFDRQGHVAIVDMGGEARYWSLLGLPYLKRRNVTITLVNKHEENLPSNPDPRGCYEPRASRTSA